MFVRGAQKLLNLLIRHPNGQHLTLRKYAKNLSQLTKFKLSVLNSIVAACSFCLYPSPQTILPLLGGSLALSMSTQVINQYMEVEYDKMMVRTRQRPLPQEVFSKKFALGLGIALGATGILGLCFYNYRTAMIGAAIWIGYVALYTPMKRTSKLNTFFGAIVGSLPVYLGWVAANRSVCMVQPFAMFMYMMAWQHQHFYGIRWVYFDDYNKAGFKMEDNKQIASLITVGQIVLALLFVNYSYKYSQLNVGYMLNMVTCIGMYKWGIEAMHKFSKSEYDGKKIKMESYKHFFLFFGIIFANFLYRYYKGEQWKNVRNVPREQCIVPYL